MDTSNEDQCTFLIISRSILLRMRSASDRNCRLNQNTHLMFFFRLCLLWDNVKKDIVGSGRSHGACALQAGFLRLQAHTQNM
jgi:hypothetical protein